MRDRRLPPRTPPPEATLATTPRRASTGTKTGRCSAHILTVADETAQPAPPEWFDALAEGRAHLATGDATPWTEARARLAALQDALKAEQARRHA